MSKRITGLTAMAVGAILGVGRSAVSQDPTITDHHGRAVARRHDQAPITTEGRAL